MKQRNLGKGTEKLVSRVAEETPAYVSFLMRHAYLGQRSQSCCHLNPTFLWLLP
jgi:hypothetical protein